MAMDKSEKMDVAALKARIAQLELEPARLRARPADIIAGGDTPAHGGIGQLCGLWRGRIDASEEELEAVEFSMRWLDEKVLS